MKKLLLFLLSVMMAVTVVSITPVTAYAADTRESIDKTSIFDDLSSFDLSEYPADKNGGLSVMYFQEYCFNSNPTEQDRYGLYFYLYNPTEKPFNTDFVKVEIGVTYDQSGNLAATRKVGLTFLSKTSNNRFYKFKMTDMSPFVFCEELYNNSFNRRRYDVVGVEVKYSDGKTITDNNISTTYYFSGYAVGCNGNNTESTLQCTYDRLSTVDIKVHQTFYRPEGDYYEGKQSQLNSCFFSVGDTFFEKYGDLTSIFCEWYEYLTKPILVTENNTLFKKLYKLHGDSFFSISDLWFLLVGLSNKDVSWFGSHSDELGWCSNYWAYFAPYWFDFLPVGDPNMELPDDIRFDSFAAVFYNGHYQNATVSSDDLMQQLFLNSEKLGNLIEGTNYSADLFTDYVCNGHILGYNQKDVSIDDDVDLYFNRTTKDFWQNVFGGYNVETLYDSIEAFHFVSAQDLIGTDEQVAERLYIYKDDVAALRKEFESSRNSDNPKQVIIFRYATSDYYSIPVVQAVADTSTSNVDEFLAKACWNEWRGTPNYTGYYAQETVYLNFDIISFTFTDNNGTQTVIPVVSDPTDAIAAITSPLEENYHGENARDWLRTLLMIILGVLVFILVIVVFFKIASLIAAKKQTAALKHIEENQKNKRGKK